ncbi:molybdenum cofactor guanylyltransferase [Heyndrickxia sp. MSNUG]|uniref:molybdenum cofactor guanylyltransferase n=1 Tax=Heyndrickxia sp. MSNUG TaxID=3136677 RepID=UPI003C2FBEC3
MKAGAIVLSGGKSSRMGKNKALLKFHEKTNIEIILGELKHVFDDIILVTNEPETYHFLDIKIVTDQYKESGPLAGIHAGLEASDYEENFVVACDMPFVSGELAASLIKELKHHEAVVPISEGRQHPLFAAYQKRAAVVAKDCIEEGKLRMKHLLDRLDVRYLDEQDLNLYCEGNLERVFFNMNRPEEYEEAKKMTQCDR